MIRTLIDKGYAYEKNGTVYYRTRAFKEYGKLSHKNIDDLRSGERELLVRGEDEKEDPLDFVLWKPKKEGEPFWESPWSDGRPGWHIECSVMIPIVTFGNRSYDNALIELVEELGAKGFRSIAGACVPSEHAFIAKLAAGRPDSKDLEELSKFASKTAEKLMALSELPTESIHVPGEYPAPYYKPLGADGKPAVFLKAKPKTDEDKCDRCGTCESMCPMGSISKEDPMMVDGVCIKCQACVRKCPRGAKYFDDPDFLSHGIKKGMSKAMTEEELAVKSGYWHLFRYNPAAKAEGKPMFTLDSKAPTEDYKEFLNGEVRYNSLVRQNPARAEELFAKSEEEAKARFEYLNKLVGLYGNE